MARSDFSRHRAGEEPAEACKKSPGTGFHLETKGIEQDPGGQ